MTLRPLAVPEGCPEVRRCRRRDEGRFALQHQRALTPTLSSTREREPHNHPHNIRAGTDSGR